jgi:ketosteroid isomerase-like protein
VTVAPGASPLEVVAAFGDTWANHDLDGAIALITEDCVFDNTDPAPDGTRYVGRKAIRGAWAPIFDDASSHFEAEETFSVGDRVVQRWRYSWSDGHVRGVDVMRVRDGKVSEKLSYVKG